MLAEDALDHAGVCRLHNACSIAAMSVIHHSLHGETACKGFELVWLQHDSELYGGYLSTFPSMCWHTTGEHSIPAWLQSWGGQL